MTRHRLIWRWRRHMARHREYIAWLNYLRWPDPVNQRRLETAARYLDRVDCDKPW
jgi:hypothetical protein